jgi:GNAT superfamily N-acetyltransferase
LFSLRIRTLECVRDISITYHKVSCIPPIGENVLVEVRTAGATDVDRCLDVQRRAALVGYAHIFDQTRYPFPDDVVREEWVARLHADSGVEVLLALVDGEVVGTASARNPRLEALFVVPEQWGSGVSGLLHDRVLARIAAAGCDYAELDVMTENLRARRFYERRGWQPDGRRLVSPFPPFPRLLGYAVNLTEVASRRGTIRG